MLARTLPLAVAALVLAAVPAAAQKGPVQRQLAPLDGSDQDLLQAAAAKLYQADAPAVGAEQSWSNPDTGNAGRVALIEVFERDGMPCRRLRHNVTLAKNADPLDFAFSRCQVADGSWRLLDD